MKEDEGHDEMLDLVEVIKKQNLKIKKLDSTILEKDDQDKKLLSQDIKFIKKRLKKIETKLDKFIDAFVNFSKPKIKSNTENK